MGAVLILGLFFGFFFFVVFLFYFFYFNVQKRVEIQ